MKGKKVKIMEENNTRKANWPAILIIVAIAALVCIGFAVLDNSLTYNSNQIHDLVNQVQDMEHTFAKSAETKKAPEESTTDAPEEPTAYTQAELTQMMVSGKFEDLLTVATYPEATESQLLFIAAYCAQSDLGNDQANVIRLASSLIDHPSATATVMSALACCKSQFVWLLVAQSELCSETTLAILAENCTLVKDENNIKSSIPTSVAIAILENDAVTEQIVNFLIDSNGYIEYINDIRLGKITG